MGVIWVQGTQRGVEDTVTAVQEALASPAETTAVPIEDQFMGDTYLAEQVATMRSNWAIDPWTTVTLGAGAFGRLFLVGQRLLRRLTWWYTGPQIEQVSRFNASVVRTTDSIVTRLWDLDKRLLRIEADNEAVNAAMRIKMLEEQLRVTRESQSQLAQRCAQLEAQLTVSNESSK